MRLLLVLHKFLQRIQKATSTTTTSSSQTLLNVPIVALSSPNRSSMAAASHTFPTTLFTSPLRSLSHFKPKLGSNPIWVSSPLRAFVPLSSKISFGFSNSRVSGLGDGSSGIRGRRYSGKVYASAVTEKSIHDFTVKDIDGKDVSLSKFKGKVLLIVNVASRCGLTSSNYTELAQLYEKYKAQGFEILAFPCNQFGSQEPGTNTEIKQFACTRFKAEYPIFDKIEVNGPNTAPVYQFLKSSAGGFLGDLIKWNFEKFLVNKDGKVVERYPPTTSPFQIEKDIQKALAAA